MLVGAPATEIDVFVERGGDSGTILLVAALAATGDEFDAASVVNEAGEAALEEIDSVCQDGYTFLGSELLTVDVATTEPWAGAIAAQVPGGEPGARRS